MTEKSCTKCHEAKPLEDFYKKTSGKYGRSAQCKRCECAKVKAYSQAPENKERIKAYKAEYHRDPDNREKHKEYLKVYRGSDKEKARLLDYQRDYRKRSAKKCAARKAVNEAVRCGKLEKPACCSECGSGGLIDGHHDSYDETKWLDVRWLCRLCHVSLHKKADRKAA